MYVGISTLCSVLSSDVQCRQTLHPCYPRYLAINCRYARYLLFSGLLQCIHETTKGGGESSGCQWEMVGGLIRNARIIVVSKGWQLAVGSRTGSRLGRHTYPTGHIVITEHFHLNDGVFVYTEAMLFLGEGKRTIRLSPRRPLARERTSCPRWMRRWLQLSTMVLQLWDNRIALQARQVEVTCHDFWSRGVAWLALFDACLSSPFVSKKASSSEGGATVVVVVGFWGSVVPTSPARKASAQLEMRETNEGKPLTALLSFCVHIGEEKESERKKKAERGYLHCGRR